MKVQVLSQAIAEKVRISDELLLELGKANSNADGSPRKIDTIRKWIREQNVILTTATNLQIIRQYFRLSDSEVLTEEKGVGRVSVAATA